MHEVDRNHCPVCTGAATVAGHSNRDIYCVACQRCGEFKITFEAITNSRSRLSDLRIKANTSGWIRENQGCELLSYNIDNALTARAPGYVERADRLLVWMGNQTPYAGEMVAIDPSWYAVSWCANRLELDHILEFLFESKRISKEHGAYIVKPAGWIRIEELSKVSSKSDQGFVAMWFRDSMSVVYDKAIAHAIDDAGYRAHRVDKKEHNGKIDDEIVAEIRKSKFVIADFTGHRGGVYFEAGFARGLGIEVIWTCRDIHFKRLHFDIRQYNCIKWTINDLDAFRHSLRFRIESVLGEGPLKNR